MKGHCDSKYAPKIYAGLEPSEQNCLYIYNSRHGYPVFSLHLAWPFMAKVENLCRKSILLTVLMRVGCVNEIREVTKLIPLLSSLHLYNLYIALLVLTSNIVVSTCKNREEHVLSR